MFFVYILKLNNKKYYVGYSNDLEARIKDHRSRKVNSTKNKNPHLIFYAAFSTKTKALKFEKYLKSSSGFAFRNKRLI